jgi:hypothetical protein
MCLCAEFAAKGEDQIVGSKGYENTSISGRIGWGADIAARDIL